MIEIQDFLKTLGTNSGFWNPLVWGIIMAISFLIVYIIRGRGKKEYKKETEQTKVFLSGNDGIKYSDNLNYIIRTSTHKNNEYKSIKMPLIRCPFCGEKLGK